MMRETCPCLIGKFPNEKCGLTEQIVDGDDCEEFAAICPELITLSQNPYEKIVQRFNKNYVSKAISFYNNLNEINSIKNDKTKSM